MNAPTLFDHARQRDACQRLEALVAKTRDSYECRRYRERRAAALRGRVPTLVLTLGDRVA